MYVPANILSLAANNISIIDTPRVGSMLTLDVLDTDLSIMELVKHVFVETKRPTEVATGKVAFPGLLRSV
jgi:hypothetical protein